MPGSSLSTETPVKSTDKNHFPCGTEAACTADTF